MIFNCVHIILINSVRNEEDYLPMIPLGLKETKEVDFFEQFSDFILEHYSVDPTNFEEAILDLIDTRQVRSNGPYDLEF